VSHRNRNHFILSKGTFKGNLILELTVRGTESGRVREKHLILRATGGGVKKGLTKWVQGGSYLLLCNRFVYALLCNLAPMTKAKTKLLIAEDDPKLRRQYEYILSDAGHDVESVASGEAAYEALLSNHYDLVVTDIEMGGSMSGVAIADRGCVDYPKTKIIVVTGMVGIEDVEVEQSQLPGAHVMLVKPVLPEKLVSTVESALH